MRNRSNPTFESRVFEFANNLNDFNVNNFQTTNSEFFRPSNFQTAKPLNAKDLCTGCANTTLQTQKMTKADFSRSQNVGFEKCLIEADYQFNQQTKIEKENLRTKLQEINRQNKNAILHKKRTFTRERTRENSQIKIDFEKTERENLKTQITEKQNRKNLKDDFREKLKVQIIDNEVKRNNAKYFEKHVENLKTSLDVGTFKPDCKIHLREFLLDQIGLKSSLVLLEVN